MAKNQRSDGQVRRPNRWRLVFYGILAVLLIAIIIIVKNIISLKIEEGKLKKQEQELQGKKEELTAELQGVDELDYIEEQARKLLKMIKPGEMLFILTGEDPRPEGSSGPVSIDPSQIPPPPAPANQEETTESQEVYYEEEIVYTEEEITSEEEVTEGELTEEEATEETEGGEEYETEEVAGEESWEESAEEEYSEDSGSDE